MGESCDRRRIAIVHDANVETSNIEEWMNAIDEFSSGNGAYSAQLFPVSSGVSLFRAVRHIKAGGFHVVLNLCRGSNEDEDAASANMVALLLEEHGVAYTGCRSATLSYPLDVVWMMIWYAEIPLPRFSVVHEVGGAHAGLAPLMGRPVEVSSTSPWFQHYRVTLRASADDDKNVQLVEEAVEQHGSVIMWNTPLEADDYERVRVIVCASAEDESQPVVIVRTPAAIATSPGLELLVNRLKSWGASFTSNVLYNVGSAELVFAVRVSILETEQAECWNSEDCHLCGFHFNVCKLSLQQEGSTGHGRSEEVRHMMSALFHSAVNALPAPKFVISLDKDSRKGYRLCAATDIPKGSLVFEDEGRAFAIVTRPHVEAYWSAQMKHTFTEYAWPLDSDGHLYAIWEKDPRRWRPINHSCDPSCVFAAPHSLNVISTRNIKRGEDLTMDYATFCDGTMKPFECLCGSSQCRRWIQADSVSLAKYGANAWFRKIPSPVKPFE